MTSKIIIDRLTKAIEALPEESREAVVEELEEHVTQFGAPHMSEAQRAEVERRLALPRRHVPDSEVRAILRRYNPAL